MDNKELRVEIGKLYRVHHPDAPRRAEMYVYNKKLFQDIQDQIVLVLGPHYGALGSSYLSKVLFQDKIGFVITKILIEAVDDDKQQ